MEKRKMLKRVFAAIAAVVVVALSVVPVCASDYMAVGDGQNLYPVGYDFTLSAEIGGRVVNVPLTQTVPSLTDEGSSYVSLPTGDNEDVYVTVDYSELHSIPMDYNNVGGNGVTCSIRANEEMDGSFTIYSAHSVYRTSNTIPFVSLPYGWSGSVTIAYDYYTSASWNDDTFGHYTWDHIVTIDDSREFYLLQIEALSEQLGENASSRNFLTITGYTAVFEGSISDEATDLFGGYDNATGTIWGTWKFNDELSIGTGTNSYNTPVFTALEPTATEGEYTVHTFQNILTGGSDRRLRFNNHSIGDTSQSNLVVYTVSGGWSRPWAQIVNFGQSPVAINATTLNWLLSRAEPHDPLNVEDMRSFSLSVTTPYSMDFQEVSDTQFGAIVNAGSTAYNVGYNDGYSSALDDTDFGILSFLTSAVGGFFDAEFFPGVSIGGIFLAVFVLCLVYMIIRHLK